MIHTVYLYVFFMYLLIIISGVYSYLYIFYSKYDFANNPIISEIEKNLNGKLIYSFRLSKSCKSDEEKLILGKWDGIHDGCDCEYSILDKKCTDEQIKNGCKTIFSLNSIDYTIFNSNYICVKTSKLKYIDLLRTEQVISIDKECPINYKSCGKIDTFERKLCIKKNESWPLNSIDFQNFSNGDEAQILTIFKLGQDLPCINPSEKVWDYYYELEPQDQRCSTKIKGKLFDDRFEELSNFTTNKLTLYNDNLITNKLKNINKINLEEMENHIIYIYGRNFLGFNINNKYNYDNLLNNQKHLNNSFYAHFIISILAIVSFIFPFILLTCFKESKINLYSFECELNLKGIISMFTLFFVFFMIFYSWINFIVNYFYK